MLKGLSHCMKMKCMHGTPVASKRPSGDQATRVTSAMCPKQHAVCNGSGVYNHGQSGCVFIHACQIGTRSRDLFPTWRTSPDAASICHTRAVVSSEPEANTEGSEGENRTSNMR